MRLTLLFFLVACTGEQKITTYNTAPKVNITFPTSSDVLSEYTPVVLIADVNDKQEPLETLDYTWSADRGGTLTGALEYTDDGVRFSIVDGLPSGTTTITLEVTDSDAESEVDSVIVDINPNHPPRIQFTEPSPASFWSDQMKIPVAVQAEDGDESDLSVLSLQWAGFGGETTPLSLAADGTASFEIGPLQPGQYSWEVQVADRLGAQSTDTLSVSVVPADADADGDPDIAWGGGDCDDNNPSVSSLETEVCNGIDDDCIGDVDDNAADAKQWFADADGDSFGDSSVVDYACEQPLGMVADATDCDDSVVTTFPGAPEFCNGVDEDCDGVLDNDPVDPLAWYPDGDTDGYGENGGAVLACVAPAGMVADATDCADADPSVHPGATELCNGKDDDCDGTVDQGAADASIWYADADGDGYGDPAVSSASCQAPSGTVANSRDCNDSFASISPAASESCNGIDDNCDGLVDDASAVDAPTWYDDGDGDGYGNPSSPTIACSTPLHAVSDRSDCDDGSAAIFPGATEYCNGLDDNCDGATDESTAVDAITTWADADGDGYGNLNLPTTNCLIPSGTVSNSTDCDDNIATVNPSASEVCNGYDDDCDGTTDLNAIDAPSWYTDADGDGYGDSASAQINCSQPISTISDRSDCDDTRASVHPGASELCNSMDDNCDGAVDEVGSVGATLRYADTDGDTYGNPNVTILSCSLPSGYVNRSGDCVDADPAVSPAATEICNDGVDNDCDGTYNNCGLVGTNFGTNATTKLTGILASDKAGATVLALNDFDGDGVGEAVLGAETASISGSALGAVYLFSHPKGAKLSASNATVTLTGVRTADRFGAALYSPGDTDQDGLADLVIGATGDSISSNDSGAAYFFYGRSGSSNLNSTQADASLYGATSSDFAANSFSSVENFDNGGTDGLLIGASKADDLAPDAGTVYLQTLPVYGTNSLGGATLVVRGVHSNDHLGVSVATADLNGDGIGDVVAGADLLDNGSYSNSGGVYYLEGPLSGTIDVSVATCLWVGTSSNEGVGGALGSPGDLDGDGKDDLVIGASGDDANGANAGAVYELRHLCSGTADLSGAEAKIYGEAALDGYGALLSTPADTDADGIPEYLVGATDAGVMGVNSGGGYLWEGSQRGTLSAARAVARFSGDSTYDYAGAISAAGDFNGDAAGDVIVGGAQDDEVASNAGAAWLFYGGGL